MGHSLSPVMKGHGTEIEKILRSSGLCGQHEHSAHQSKPDLQHYTGDGVGAVPSNVPPQPVERDRGNEDSGRHQ